MLESLGQKKNLVCMEWRAAVRNEKWCYDVRTEDKTYDKLQNWCNAKQINWIVFKKNLYVQNRSHPELYRWCELETLTSIVDIQKGKWVFLELQICWPFPYIFHIFMDSKADLSNNSLILTKKGKNELSYSRHKVY